MFIYPFFEKETYAASFAILCISAGFAFISSTRTSELTYAGIRTPFGVCIGMKSSLFKLQLSFGFSEKVLSLV